jgi:DNA polymerase-3 subunit epsilon
VTREPLRSAGLPLAVGAVLALLTGRRRAAEAPSEAVPTIAAMGDAAGGGTALIDLEELETEPPAPPRWAEVLGVFDLETTGVDPATARIVTASVALLDEEGAVVERHDWIVDPGVPIPDAAAAVHGIDTARAQRFGRSPAQVVPEILAAIASLFDRGLPLVVYNAPYDLTLLAAEAERLGLPPLPQPAPVVDPLVLDKAVDRYRKGKRTLTAAAAEYGVELTDAHDAAADAIAAGRLAQAIARRHAAELDLTAAELHERQVAWCGEQAARFQEYMRANRDADFTTSGAWPRR